MPDIRSMPYYMEQFIKHLREREGVVNHFYTDGNGLVTIGVGILIDRGHNLREEQVPAMLAEWVASYHLTFRHRHLGHAATIDEIAEDWRRVKNGGRALLRIADVDINSLLAVKIGEFADQLYNNKPFILDFHCLVHMAILDARFNPAEVALYREEPGRNFHVRIPLFWRAMERGEYESAEEHFIEIWRNRGVPRYRQRHLTRAHWLRQGLFYQVGNVGPVPVPEW